MSSSKGPSAADQQLIDHAQRHGYTVTVKQLATWRSHGLLPGNIPGGGLGRGRGSTSRPAAHSFDLLLGLARHAGPGKRPSDLALLLFGEGLPVPEATVRSAFRATTAITIPGEGNDPAENLDDRLDDIDGHLADTGPVLTLVPARARRIDEGIARAVRTASGAWPPPDLADLDDNPEPTPLTPQGATLAAVTATLTGSLSLMEMGSLLRAMTPGLPAPIASLVETTGQDVLEDTAAAVIDPDGTLTFLPDGDARDFLRDLADATPLQDLATTWKTAQEVREWALDLCERTEAELDAGHLGEAVNEWYAGRHLLSGQAVLEALRDRRWSPSMRAFDALRLLFLRQMLLVLGSIAPGCQWHVLGMPRVLPPPVRHLLADIIDREPVPVEPTGDRAVS
ncbi:hypothetical protein [Streptomyces sp. NPDC002133]|uniref:hypothetical protein n=1 Tax=Streptomyces sp. NPDC002133 TaxID=3154409 RepID=UPI00331BB90B